MWILEIIKELVLLSRSLYICREKMGLSSEARQDEVQATPPCSWQAFSSAINREQYFKKPKRLVVSREIISSSRRPLYAVILCLRKRTETPQSLLQSVKVTEVRHEEGKKSQRNTWEVVHFIKPVLQTHSDCIVLHLHTIVKVQQTSEPNQRPLHWPTFTGVLKALRYLLHFPSRTDTVRAFISSVISSS